MERLVRIYKNKLGIKPGVYPSDDETEQLLQEQLEPNEYDILGGVPTIIEIAGK